MDFRFLDNIAVLMHSSRSEDLSEFLTAVYNAKISDPGRNFTVPFNRGESVRNPFSFHCYFIWI